VTYILGKNELKYNKDRLAKSVKRVSIANQTPTGEAENFAHQVAKKIESWIGNKTEITASELRMQTAAVMADYDPETAYLYENENKFF